MVQAFYPSRQSFPAKPLEYRQSSRTASTPPDRESIGNDIPPTLHAIRGGGQFNRRTWEESKTLYTLGLIPAHALLLDYLCLKLWRIGFSTTKLATVLAEEIGLSRSTLYRAISILKKKLPGLFLFGKPLYKGKELIGDNRIRITRIGTVPITPSIPPIDPDPEEETEEFDEWNGGEWEEEDLTGAIDLDPDGERVFIGSETVFPTSDNRSELNPRQGLPSPKNVDLLLDNFKDLSFFSRTDELIEEPETIGGGEAVTDVTAKEGRKEFLISSFCGCDGETSGGLAGESVGDLARGESIAPSMSGLDSREGSEGDRPLVSIEDGRGGSESVSPLVGVKIQRRGVESIEGGKNPLERVRQAVEWVKGKGFGNTGSVIKRSSVDGRAVTLAPIDRLVPTPIVPVTPAAPVSPDSYAEGGVSSSIQSPMTQPQTPTREPRTSPRGLETLSSNLSTSPQISDPDPREEEIKTLPPSFLRHPIVSRLSDPEQRSLWEYAVARCKELPNWNRDDRYPRIKSPTAWILGCLEKVIYHDWLAVTSTVTVESIVRGNSPAAPASTEAIVVPAQKPLSLAGKSEEEIEFYLSPDKNYPLSDVPAWVFEKYPDRVHRFIS